MINDEMLNVRSRQHQIIPLQAMYKCNKFKTKQKRKFIIQVYKTSE